MGHQTAEDAGTETARGRYDALREFLPRWLGRLALLAAIVYLGIYTFEHWSLFPKIRWGSESGAVLALAIVVYAATYALNALAWWLLLHGPDETPRLRHVTAIYFLSQFAKYIPGNVAHHIGRVMLARGLGLRTTLVLFTMAIETGWVVLVAAIIAATGLVGLGPSFLDEAPRVPMVWQLGTVGALAVIAPFLALWILNRRYPKPLRKLLGEETVAMPPARVLAICFVIYLLAFAVLGGIVDVLALHVAGARQSHFVTATGLFALAWIAGFIVPGAPGGLGVREAILVLTLTPLYGADAAVVVTVLLRLVTTVGDGLVFITGLLLRRSPPE